MKILFIEDEKGLLQSMVEYFTDEGYLCESAEGYMEASDKAWTYEYDLIVLDIMLPGGSGLDILKEVKQSHPKTGIIIISAKDSLDDKLSGLDLGADDYITKPFHLAELNSRIKALERRIYYDGNKDIVFNEYEIDPENHRVKINGEDLNLTKKEFELLLFFVGNVRRVVSKEAIAEHLWGDSSDLLDNIDFIYTHIRNIRKKIAEKGGNDYIKTIYGFGYKFTDK